MLTHDVNYAILGVACLVSIFMTAIIGVLFELLAKRHYRRHKK